MILETKRLWLREMSEDDFDDLCEMLCDEEVMKAYEHSFSLEEAHDWLMKQRNRYKKDGVGLWAVILKSNGVMIGQCGITKQFIHDEAVWEIGYVFKKDYWHQGYAIESAQGVKRYAFEVMKLDPIYSIIRDNNEASKRVARANGMSVVDHIVKHYYHKNLPHSVYMVKNKAKAMRYQVYLDGEFDALKIHHRFEQTLISLGAVICDDAGIELDQFYTTICPKGFIQLSPVVKRMTKLDNACIHHSHSLQEVMSEFKEWLKHYDQDFDQFLFYGFGPDDKRTILHHCQLEEVESGKLFENYQDLQKSISSQIRYQERVVSSTLSLDDLKRIYGIHGAVEHNALNDALDLFRIHQASKQANTINESYIQEIVERKQRREKEARLKQQKHLQQIMKERFKDAPKQVSIVFVGEVLDQFRSWEMRDENFTMHFKKNVMVLEEQVYPYEELAMNIVLDMDHEIPMATVIFHYEGEEKSYSYPIHYRNATLIETILKRCHEGSDLHE